MEDQPSKFIPMTVHDTVSRSIIMIDEASLHVHIENYGASLRRPNDFIGYALAALSTTIALASATFQEFGISGEAWKAIFLLVDGALILKAGSSALAYWKQKTIKPEDVIAKIKEDAVRTENSVVTVRPF